MNIYKRKKFINLFKIDYSNFQIIKCPGNKSPISCEYNKKAFLFKAYFNKNDCDKCSYSKKCIKENLNDTYYQVLIKGEDLKKIARNNQCCKKNTNLMDKSLEERLKAEVEMEIGSIKNAKIKKGKKYECGVIAYDGEYLEANALFGETWYCHGYGKAYYEDASLEYEGNFVYGHPQGHGKYYHRNGQVKWEGIFEAIPSFGYVGMEAFKTAEGYVDRKGRIKYGKKFDISGKLEYQGEFKLGIPEGNGKLYDDSGTVVFVGKFGKGKPIGKNKLKRMVQKESQIDSEVSDKSKNKNVNDDFVIDESGLKYVGELIKDNSGRVICQPGNKEFDDEVTEMVKCGLVFNGTTEPPITIQSNHRIGSDQRESILCFLENMNVLTDIYLSKENIVKGIVVYLHNIDVVLDESYDTLRNSRINESEIRVLNVTVERIKDLLDRIKKSENQKESVYNVLEIRRLITMLYVIIGYKMIYNQVKKITVEAYVDENSETRIVILNDKNKDNEEDVVFKWHYTLSEYLPNIKRELNKKEREFSINKYGEETVKYDNYYNEACKLIIDNKYNKAEELLDKIIKCGQVFDFTSGAYANLGKIMFIKNLGTNPKLWIGRSEALFSKALEIKPTNKVVPVNYVMLYLLVLDFEKALIWLKKCNNEETKELLKDNLKEYSIFLNMHMFFDETSNEKFNSKSATEFFSTLEELYDYGTDFIGIQLLIADYYKFKEGEGLLKAYDIYTSILKNYPNSFLGSFYLCELCGCGYLNRPFEQEDYYKKTIKLIESTEKGTYPNDVLYDFKFATDGFLISSWVEQKKWSHVLNLTKKRIRENPNNSDIHNHAVALFYLEEYQKSIEYCNRQLYISEDETTYLLLAMNYYALKDFEKAVNYYRKSLSFINDGKMVIRYKDENGKLLQSFSKKSWQTNKLKDIYIPLIDSYFRMGKYINAKAIWMSANEMFPDDIAIRTWENIINKALDDRKQIDTINKQCEKLIAEINEEREQNIKKTMTIRQWAIDLMKLQGNSENTIPNDFEWDEFERNIDGIIKKMTEEVSCGASFSSIKEEFKSKFKKLESLSIEFLTTAEYLFEFNRDNIIDFAPIMVEYCKVIELELRVILKNDKLMFGQSLEYINTFGIESLSNIYNDLEEIYKYRNGSAHVGASTAEKVQKVRQLLFERGILQTICQIKK